MSRRPSLRPKVAAITAGVFLVAGIVSWTMYAGGYFGNGGFFATSCAAPRFGAFCEHYVPPHRLHPLRAELIWAASALLALVAVGTGLWERRRPGAARPVTG